MFKKKVIFLQKNLLRLLMALMETIKVLTYIPVCIFVIFTKYVFNSFF